MSSTSLSISWSDSPSSKLAGCSEAEGGWSSKEGGLPWSGDAWSLDWTWDTATVETGWLLVEEASLGRVASKRDARSGADWINVRARNTLRSSRVLILVHSLPSRLIR